MRDFRLRRALGATTSGVLRLVVASAVRAVASGAATAVSMAGPAWRAARIDPASALRME